MAASAGNVHGCGANTSRIAQLDKGQLTDAEKNTSRPTTTRYVDKSGKVKFKGNSSLKSSQNLDIQIVHVIYSGLEIVFKNMFDSSYMYLHILGIYIQFSWWELGDPLRTYTYKYAANLVHMVADLRGDAQGRSFPLEVSMVAKPKDL